MAETKTLSEINAAIQSQIGELQKLMVQVLQIGNRIAELNGSLDNIDREPRFCEEPGASQSARKPVTADSAAPSSQCRIIAFQKSNSRGTGGVQVKSPDSCRRLFRAPVPFLAAPGESLASDLPDFRSVLQRDGLILLGWDSRDTEAGERYTAYWVTSSGTPRFYASRPLSYENFSSARPDHKSYAAEDGIEFYGQAAPAYQVHVAPELMMTNPRHRELRLVHINTLRQQGSKLDFHYPYLLKTERKQNTRPESTGESQSRKARA